MINNLAKYIEGANIPVKTTDEKKPGIVRISMGMYNNVAEINRFIDALRKL